MRLRTLAILIIISTSASNVFAKTYYVSPNGNDRSSGLSHADAWKTISKINSFAFQAGDDVYLLAGGTWKALLKIDWSGTEKNRVIIGSYYMKNGAETIGVPANKIKPTIRGTYEKAGDPLNTPSSIPTSQYSGLVQVQANYVTVQNIRVLNSAGVGITLNPRNNYHHAIFEKNEVDSTAGASITFQRSTHSNIMRNNKMRRCALGWKNKDLQDNRIWPVCNGAIGSRNNLIEGNFVSESYGEGIAAFATGANKNVIRNNTLFGVRSAAIYVDNGQNNIIENNTIIGEQVPSRYTMNKGYNGGALNLAVEDTKIKTNAVGNVFRNNLGCQCMELHRDTGAKTGPNRRIKNRREIPR